MNLAVLTNVPEKCKFQCEIQILLFTYSSDCILLGLLISEFGPKSERKTIMGIWVPREATNSVNQDPREIAELNNQVLCGSYLAIRSNADLHLVIF